MSRSFTSCLVGRMILISQTSCSQEQTSGNTGASRKVSFLVTNCNPSSADKLLPSFSATSDNFYHIVISLPSRMYPYSKNKTHNIGPSLDNKPYRWQGLRGGRETMGQRKLKGVQHQKQEIPKVGEHNHKT